MSGSVPPFARSRTAFHARHRAQAHQQAHQDAADRPAVLQHPQVCAGEPELVTTPQRRDEVLASLRDGVFAYDTEFIGEHTYHPHLCLVQVATTDHIWLLDPLSGLDLRPFWELVAEAGTVKIVHAGLQDLEPVYRHVQRPAANVFDVQIAAGFLGRPYPSALGRLVHDYLSTDVGRAVKFSQWDHRPLSAAQIRYAADDVRYLPLLRQVLTQHLEQHQRAAWAQAACAEGLDPAQHRCDPMTAPLKLRRADRLTARQAMVLRRLFMWRDDLARQRDLPPRTVVSDGVLLALARMPDGQAPDLGRLRGMPRDIKRDAGADILAAMAQGRGDLIAPGDNHHGDDGGDPDELRQAVGPLWQRLEEYCRNQQVSITLVASKRELAQWWWAQRQGRPQPGHRLNQGWRREFLAPLRLGEPA